MGVIDKFVNLFKKEDKEEVQEVVQEEKKLIPTQSYGYGGVHYGETYPERLLMYDGEKTLGELGVVINNVVDHRRLRMRAYDAYLKTDIAKIIIQRFTQHVIGQGLKLQCEPNMDILKTRNIELSEKWSDNVEAMFKLMANSKYLDYSQSQTLHEMSVDCFKAAEIGGDCLVVTRFEERGLTVQLIDGEHVVSPSLSDDFIKEAEDKGNYIEHGVEYDIKGRIVAFYVLTDDNKSILGELERISAISESTGLEVAWLVYGDKFRLDHKRGISRLANTIEKINKIDRYSEAAVGKAEQAANMFVSIEHDDKSTGENPFIDQAKRNLGTSTSKNEDSYTLSEKKAREIYQSTSNMAVNLPPGASLKQFSTDIESQFGDFYRAIFDTTCASVDLPPEVALQSYNSNYSASKAALDNWQYIVDIHRKKHINSFEDKIYRLWLTYEILENRIQAPGFVAAFNKSNQDIVILESYYQARFIGRKIPHIDPKKEVEAIRLMLGDENTPLMSNEQAAEALNLGQWAENMKRRQKEVESFPDETSQSNENKTANNNIQEE